MPRDERVLVVFLASPSDLEPERSRLEEVIRELNVTWTRTLGVRLELVSWETHGYPGVGADPQDVLNRQLPNDYDIFIGLMWTKFGTPTGRAGSGTEEEFARALSRYQSETDSLKIMFYLKDAPVSPSGLDVGQLKRVQQFPASLGKEGVLYWPFLSIEDFEKLTRLHLARQVQELTGKQNADHLNTITREVKLPLPPAVHSEPTEDEEPGYLDLLDALEEASSELGQTMMRMTAETDELTRKTNEATAEMNLAVRNSRGKIPRSEARRLVNSVAGAMRQYAARIKADLPMFREGTSRTADLAARIGLMTTDVISTHEQQARAARNSLAGLSNVLSAAYDQATIFKTNVRQLIRLTSELNRAKRETIEVLDEVSTTVMAASRVIQEAVKTIDGMLGPPGGSSGA